MLYPLFSLHEYVADFAVSQSDWSHLRDDPRLGVQQMAYYLALFWVKVHETQAPAVHRASFRPAAAPTPLLLSMVRSSSTYRSRAELTLFVVLRCRCSSARTLHRQSRTSLRSSCIRGSAARFFACVSSSAGSIPRVLISLFTQSPDFRPRSEVWLMQTMLLIVVFGKLCSSTLRRCRVPTFPR